MPPNPPAPTVIVPVYDAVDDLARCLDSLAATLGSETEVLLIDDASPDRRIAPLLQRTCTRPGPRWRLLANAGNIGFVATANRGFAATQGDVVLLNSDTQVTCGWLERLTACAASDPRIATITPFTNNGEIVSFPEFCRPNPWPNDPERIARACLAAGPPSYPDIPTAVGFCMYLRRAALDDIGPFDPAFGRGYGEENDFCRRAAVRGWRNVLCDDAFVAHRGGASFSLLGLKPDRAALDLVTARHPDYPDLVRTFIAADPLAERRRKIKAALERAG